MGKPDAAVARRRSILAGLGAVCAAALTGCTRYNANNGGLDGRQPANSTTAAATTPGSSAAASSGPAALAETSQVPVGGGTILADKKIVITQPAAGSFEAFTAICTHLGCTVSSVSSGTINCPCHGSKFSISNGSVVSGPATSPLAPVNIKVQGSSIFQA